MSKKKSKPMRQWEQALIDAYYDYRYREVLEPLYEKFQQWKAAALTHADIDQAIHQTYRENQRLYSLFAESRDFLVGTIQFGDKEWFERWVKDHPEPIEGATSATGES